MQIFFWNFLWPIFFTTVLTEEYVIRYGVFLLLHKLKKMKTTLPLPVIYTCCTYINTCRTKPNDAGHFDWPITIRKRANHVAGSRWHLFIYCAMRHNLCSPFSSAAMLTYILDVRLQFCSKVTTTLSDLVVYLNCQGSATNKSCPSSSPSRHTLIHEFGDLDMPLAWLWHSLAMSRSIPRSSSGT